MQGFEEFDVDLLGVLKRRLIRQLNSMPSEVLTERTASYVPDVQGIYQLFHKGELVYIGKTDAEAGLRTRLARHARKILHRPTLVDGVRFKAIRVTVFNAMDVETLLIKHYRRRSANNSIAWNGKGFGSNDPGRRRETTNVAPDGFDAQHPINIDIAETWITPPPNADLFNTERLSVAELLKDLKAALPYTLRYETLVGENGRAQHGHPHRDLVDTHVGVPSPQQTVRGLMQTVVAALGSEWQATVFPSHVILYKENQIYTHGSRIGSGSSTP